MDSQTFRKIIVASSMAAVIAIGVATWALRSHPVTSVAQAPQSPAPVAPTPAQARAIAQIPDSLPAADEIAEVRVSAQDDRADTKSADTSTPSAVEPRRVPSRHVAKADTSAVALEGIAKHMGPVADTSESSSAVDYQKLGTSSDFPMSDNQITSDVKSAIAGDSLSNDADIQVTTNQGVVVLTGSLADQDAIDQVRDAARKVKDVKSVDTSALILATR
jgi:hyperosmotically inducible protein